VLVRVRGAWARGAATVPGGTTGGAAGGLVNINTADVATLETLNGVGPVLAASIVQFRTDNGPFTSVDQLDEVSGIGTATLEELRPQVTV
jgi:competence protein ComEA